MVQLVRLDRRPPMVDGRRDVQSGPGCPERQPAAPGEQIGSVDDAHIVSVPARGRICGLWEVSGVNEQTADGESAV